MFSRDRRIVTKRTNVQRYTNHEHQTNNALTVVTEPDAGLFPREQRNGIICFRRVYLSVWVRFPDGALFSWCSFWKKFMVDVVPLLGHCVKVAAQKSRQFAGVAEIRVAHTARKANRQIPLRLICWSWNLKPRQGVFFLVWRRANAFDQPSSW